MAVKGSFGPALVATGPATVVTAPATEHYQNVYLHVSNPTAAAVSLTMSIGADAAGTRVIGTNTVANIAANGTRLYGPFRVPAGSTIQLSAGTNNVLVVQITYDRQVA